MVEALRAKMVELHAPMDMVALSIRRIDDWAWLVGQPRPPGTQNDDSFDPVQGLLRKVSGTWQLAEIACTEDGNAACIGGVGFVQAMVKNHPGVPEELLPKNVLPASLDVLLGGERHTGPLAELAKGAELKPDEGFKIIEVGRDERSSHHIVALRGREPVHRHDEHDLLVYAFEGEGGMLIGDEERWIGRGSIVYVPRGTVHSMRNTSSTPMLGYAVFTPPFDGKDRVPAKDPLPAQP